MRPLHLGNALVLLLAPSLAAAHISMTFPEPRSSEQKTRHCGGPTARANVSTFLPGQTITVTWLETVNHTGWYRISFNADGDDFRIPPESNGPCAISNTCGPSCPGTTCNFPTEDFTGMTDPGTGSLVIADRIPDGMLSFDITLPDTECANCTLQLIQLMTEGHGDYNEDPNEGNDIYYQCADIVLSATAADAAPGEMDAPRPVDDAGFGIDGGTDNDGDGGGCCSAGGTGPSQIALGAIVVGLLLRRRVER